MNKVWKIPDLNLYSYEWFIQAKYIEFLEGGTKRIENAVINQASSNYIKIMLKDLNSDTKIVATIYEHSLEEGKKYNLSKGIVIITPDSL